MDRLLTWSVGAAVLLLAVAACSRNEKAPKPTTESAGRGDALPETAGTGTAPSVTPVTPSAARSATPTPAPTLAAAPSGTPSAATAIPPVAAAAAMPAAVPPSPSPSAMPSPTLAAVSSGTAAPSQPAPPVAAAERVFIAEAAASGLGEIEAGRLMAVRSTDQGVKTFARMLEREHLSSNGELKRIAEAKGIVLPESASKETRAVLDRLRSLPTPESDRIFVREFGVEAHNKVIRVFEKEAREGQDPQLRTYAEQTLPRLREHLIMAEQLQSKAASH